MRTAITLVDCQGAEGRKLEFYECLARYAGDFMFACSELAPRD